MHIKYLLFFVFLEVCVIRGSVLVWSNKKVDISPLLPFDDEDLERLIKELDVSKVFLFKVALKNKNSFIPRNLKEVIDPFHSSYNANGNIGTANATELTLSEDCNGIDTHKIRRTTGILSNSTNFLCVLDIIFPRKKRAIDDPTVLEEPPTKTTDSEGPVIYIGHNKINDQYALLYSSKLLKLEINNNTKYLGNIDNSLITVDRRINIPFNILEENEKIILRFLFSWVSGYWYLQTAKVEFFGEQNDSYRYTLNTSENIMAAAHFSYHCNGQSVFSDPSSETKLTIYDLQVQIDAKSKKFGDVYDCVPFTTAPIWSGIFVTTILGVGLVISLTAIMDIKTMDKFDRQGTKGLSITVME